MVFRDIQSLKIMEIGFDFGAVGPFLERLRLPQYCGSEASLVLLVGADTFLGMGSWHRRERLFELAHVAVACRPGFTLEARNLPAALAEIFHQRHCADPACLGASPAGCLVTFPMTPLDVSATRIRALLSRGYAIVRDASGAIVTTAARARDAGHLRLQFADGEVPVTIAGSDPPPAQGAPRPARKPSAPPPKRGQGELF